MCLQISILFPLVFELLPLFCQPQDFSQYITDLVKIVHYSFLLFPSESIDFMITDLVRLLDGTSFPKQERKEKGKEERKEVKGRGTKRRKEIDQENFLKVKENEVLFFSLFCFLISSDMLLCQENQTISGFNSICGFFLKHESNSKEIQSSTNYCPIKFSFVSEKQISTFRSSLLQLV